EPVGQGEEDRMTLYRLIGLAAAAAVLGWGCARMPGAQTAAAGDATPRLTLYTRLGGQPAIAAVVDDFVTNVAADSRINGRFANTNVPRLKVLLVEQVCQAAGGRGPPRRRRPGGADSSGRAG